MKSTWMALGIGASLALVARPAPGQGSAEADHEPRLLSLGTTAFRATIERNHPAFENWPDLRLKLKQPDEPSLSLEGLEPRLRGVEFRLPMSFFWVGYEWPTQDEISRATFSLQRAF